MRRFEDGFTACAALEDQGRPSPEVGSRGLHRCLFLAAMPERIPTLPEGPWAKEVQRSGVLQTGGPREGDPDGPRSRAAPRRAVPRGSAWTAVLSRTQVLLKEADRQPSGRVTVGSARGVGQCLREIRHRTVACIVRKRRKNNRGSHGRARVTGVAQRRVDEVRGCGQIVEGGEQRGNGPLASGALANHQCDLCRVKLIDTSGLLLTGASRFVLGHGLTPRRPALARGSRGREQNCPVESASAQGRLAGEQETST